MKTQMHYQDDDSYRGANGFVMKREAGLTPNGNPIDYRWVLRDKNGGWIDMDKYRLDLADRHDLVLLGDHT
jgi:hypothetical protein